MPCGIRAGRRTPLLRGQSQNPVTQLIGAIPVSVWPRRGRCYPRPVSRSPDQTVDDAVLGAASAMAADLVQACARAVRAPQAVIEACVGALLSGGHVIVEDVPGVGKTVLAKALARASGCSYSRVQCTSDLMPADVTGTSVWHQGEAVFRFHPGPVFANLVLVDEINRASPKTQSSLLEAMEEGQVTVDGTTRGLPAPFMVVATQNPVEYEGTYPLPEAQLDRFSVRVSLGYPAPEDEAAMLMDLASRDAVEDVPVVADERALVAAQRAVAGVHVDHALADYVVDLVRRTRSDPRVELGASPRAGLSLLRSARARALIHGRDSVLPKDVRGIAPLALAHRILLTPDARARGVDVADVVEDALLGTPVPLS
jgi:MoxR-like ATPase